jgi:VanZ family protein
MYCGPALGYTVLIFFMSSLPGSSIKLFPFPFFDKILHFLEFGLLGIFLYRSFRFYRPFKKPYLLTLAVGIPYAALDEIHQFFVPGRHCDITDLSADILGVILFAALSSRQHRR